MKTQPIGGTTRCVGLLGRPVAHSISPRIHNHLFHVYGLPYAYVPLDVAPADLPSVVHAMRACGFLGANVTIPHKQQVIHSCDIVSPLSARIRTVNTLCFKGGLLHGTTTDPEGFLRALAWMGHDCRGGHCVLLGNGGTARTLGFALALERLPATLSLVGRSRERVRALAVEIASETGMETGHTTFDSPELDQVMARCTLCVNCTSVGMHPHEEATPLAERYLHGEMTVFDAIYNPSRTLLLQQAEQRGCAVQNGLRMLVYQGLASFRLWTGLEPEEHHIDLDELRRRLTKRGLPGGDA